MVAKNKHLIIAFLIVSLLMCLSLIQINRFMTVLSTCDDDFAVIDKCGCVPCSWEKAVSYNGNDYCKNSSEIKNG